MGTQARRSSVLTSPAADRIRQRIAPEASGGEEAPEAGGTAASTDEKSRTATRAECACRAPGGEAATPRPSTAAAGCETAMRIPRLTAPTLLHTAAGRAPPSIRASMRSTIWDVDECRCAALDVDEPFRLDSTLFDENEGSSGGAPLASGEWACVSG